MKMHLFYLVAFSFSITGWGMIPYMRFFRHEREPLERFLILQGCGLTMSWLFVFLISTIHILHPTLIHLWILAGFLIHLLLWRKEIYQGAWWVDIFSGFDDKYQKSLMILLASMSILAYCVFLFYAQAPTTTWDPLDYHYVMPSEWLRAGGFVNLPRIMYSNFPASVELIWLIGMALNGDILSNLLTWWMGILLGLTILLIGKKWFSPIAGWIGLTLFLALPIVYTEEMPGGVIDLAVFCFNLLTLHFAIQYAKNENREDFILAILFASNGLAMKHSSLLTSFFAACAILYILYKKNKDNAGFKKAFLFFLFSFTLAVPWYLKSFIYTGNPVYPFLEKIFHPDSKLTTDILYWSNPNFTRGIFDWITYWYRVVTDVSMTQFRFRLINGIYLGLLPFIYWAVRKKGYHRAFIAYSFFIIFLLIYQAPGEPRYMMAAWALLGIALAFGIYESGIMSDSTMRQLIPLALIVPITIMLIMCIHENRKKIDFILGNQDKRSYYMSNVFGYKLIDYMNTRTPENSVVIWCDPRVYLFEREYIPAYPFDSGDLPSWRKPTGEIVQGWRDIGATHLGFTMAANYRAWVVSVILTQAEIDGVKTGYMYVDDNLSPGYKYEENQKLMFSYIPMNPFTKNLGPLTRRALQLASYTTDGLDYVKKDGAMCYRADLDKLFKERNYDVDVIMMKKLLYIKHMEFLKPVQIAPTEGILFEIDYSKLEKVRMVADYSSGKMGTVPVNR